MMSIPILMYHQVAVPVPRGSAFRGLTVHPKSFARQMQWMHRLGYRGLSMRDLMPYLKGEQTGKVFGITFDDGFRNVFENALPVLQACGFTSTNYFVANQFDGGNVWDAEKGVAPSSLMSKQEMRAWAEAGQEVGSHTLDHVHLSALSLDAAREQLKMHPFVANKTWTQALNFSLPQLHAIYQKLLDTDIAIKTGRSEPVLTLDVLIVELTK